MTADPLAAIGPAPIKGRFGPPFEGHWPVSREGKDDRAMTTELPAAPSGMQPFSIRFTLPDLIVTCHARR